MQAVKFRTLCRACAKRGEKLQAWLLDSLEGRQNKRSLPDFGIDRASQLAGCTPKQIKTLEASGRLPQPRTIESGAIQRRVYTYSDISTIRESLGNDPFRPPGSKPVRVAFSNLKGGIGKSTHALHLAQYLAREGCRTLLIDSDPQATVTSAFGIVPDLDLKDGEDLYLPLTESPELIKQAIRKTHWPDLDLVPARLAVQFVDWKLYKQDDVEKLGPVAVRLDRAIAFVEDNYDIIVVDTPPSMSMLTLNAIAAANIIIMPLVPHMYDLTSSVQYFKVLDQMCDLFEKHIKAQRLNILLTKCDSSTETSNTIAIIDRAYGEIMLRSRMGTTRELLKAGNDQLSIYEISQPRGSRETYNRAVEMLDAVNSEILMAVRQLWHHEELADIEAG